MQLGALNHLAIAGFRLIPGLFDLLVGPLLSQFEMAHDDTPATDGNVFTPDPDGEAVRGRWRAI